MNNQKKLIQSQIDNLEAGTEVFRAQTDTLRAQAALLFSQAEELNIKNAAMSGDDNIDPARTPKKVSKKRKASRRKGR